MKAITKNFEIIPWDTGEVDGEGNPIMSTSLIIPKEIAGTNDVEIKNPTISLSVPILRGEQYTFNIDLYVDDIPTNPVWTFTHEFTYDEFRAAMFGNDFSTLPIHQGPYVDGGVSFDQIFGTLIVLFDFMLLEVYWLKGKLQAQ